MDISFIIPTYNEQENIVDVLNSIKNMMADTTFSYEIIVVDDASTDSTAMFARTTGAKVVLLNEKRYPSYVRNVGAKQAQGKVLIFLDGDVLLTPAWSIEINNTHNKVLHESIITGSVVSIPENPNWLVKAWFSPITNRPKKYINSGHLIVSKETFQILNGFDEMLETNEDVDFSVRARKAKIKIINNPKLTVIHLGYPNTISVFFQRERWHNRGNFASLNQILAKVPLIILSMLLMFIVSVGFALTGNLLGIGIFLMYFVGINILFAIHRTRTISLNLLPCTFLSMVWCVARGVSIIDVFLTRLSNKIESKLQ